MNIENMSIDEIRNLQSQLDVIRQAGLAKYNKGDLIIEDVTVNKGGGLSLRFKGSRFPVNMYGSQLVQIIKHGQSLLDTAKALSVDTTVK